MLTRPALLLRLEDACLVVATLFLYARTHVSWWLFAALFLVPDAFMLAYLANPRAGAALYNLGHTIFLPLALFALAFVQHHQTSLAVSIVWLAHIAFDRMMGYGLKYPTFFKDTHLQRV